MLYIDATDTFHRWKGSPTGIQRTLIGLAEASIGRNDVAFCAWNQESNTWHQVPQNLLLSFFTITVAGAEPPAAPLVKPIPPKPSFDLVKWIRGVLFHLAPYAISHAWSRRQQAQERARWAEANAVPQLEQIRAKMLASLPRIEAWQAGDRVLVADSNWNQPGYYQALQNGQTAPRIIGFVYDLIQLDRVDFVGEEARDKFHTWISETAAASSEIVCISKHAANGMQRFVDSEPELARKPSVRPIQFGNRVEVIPRTSLRLGEILPDIGEDFASSPDWLLWLGSVDRRKNLEVVMLALEHLYSSGKLTKPIVVAGRRVRGADHLIQKLQHHPVLRKHAYFLESPSDELVHSLLAGAGLFIFSSWAEGYGLPVAEALQQGVPVISSNATSIPEVAGDLVDYFEPWDSRSLAELLSRFESDPLYRKNLTERAARFIPTSWDETLKDILNGSPGK